MTLALQHLYDYQDAHTMWEALRAWLNSEPIHGLRFTPWWSNAIMLVTALVFIFMLELLLTIGIQIWERRVLGRMQQRWGPQEYGGVSSRAFRRILWPIVILLALPGVLYGLQYWCGHEYAEPLSYVRLVIVGLPVLLGMGWLLSGRGSSLKRPFAMSFSKQVLTLGPILAGIGLLLILLKHLGYEVGTVRPDLWLTGSSLPLMVAFSELFAMLSPSFRRLVAWIGFTISAVFLIGIILEFCPPVDFGRFLPYLTVACTFLAFGIYMVYMCGWYWRQGFFDTIKIFFKEDVVPLNADRLLFLMAPILVYLPALLSWIVLPFGVAAISGRYVYYVVQDLNIGLLLIIVDFSLVFVAIIMSGYASNNKYALVGAMREAAELLSYEVPMLMSLLCVALFAGSLNLTEIVQRQSYTWGILPLFPAFVILLVTAIAETNRPPFDLPEAQNELLGGFLVEYSGVRFALFYVAEYANVFLVSAEIVVCFLGGWKGPLFLGLDGLWLTSLFWFLLKTYALVFVFIWVRATMPRIRIDQIMFFCWKFLVPASVIVLALTALGVVNRHPWFSANRIWNAQTFRYDVLSTPQALAVLTNYERAFFWCYNFFMLAIGVFIFALAWKILWAKRKHPLPRREVSWE